MLYEGLEAYDGIVAPVVALADLPEIHSCMENGPVERRGKLHHAGEQGFASDELGHGLDDPRVGIGVHHRGKAADNAGLKNAVGIQDDHVTVAASPAPAEVADVSAFPVQGQLALAVKYLAEPLQLLAKLHP